MIFEKRAGYFQEILATIRFRMLHVLVYKTEIVPVILCGCEIWCFTSREKPILRVCESRVVRRIFDVRGRWVWRDAKDSVVSFMSVTHHQILLT